MQSKTEPTPTGCGGFENFGKNAETLYYGVSSFMVRATTRVRPYGQINSSDGFPNKYAVRRYILVANISTEISQFTPFRGYRKCISPLNNSIFSQFVFLIFLRWISQQLRIMHYELRIKIDQDTHVRASLRGAMPYFIG